MKKKSEEDFLREFEAELENEDKEDYLNWFENQFTAEEVTEMTGGRGTPTKTMKSEKTISEDNDIDQLIGAASQLMGASESKETKLPDMPKETPNVMKVEPATEFDLSAMGAEPLTEFDLSAMGAEPLTEFDLSAMGAEPLTEFDLSAMGTETIDPLADFPGGNSAEGNLQAQQGAISTEGIDLSNMEDADLMSLLSDGFGDIGDLLSDPNAALGGADAFADFAQGEMNAQADAANPDAQGKKAKKKQGSFMEKLSKFLFGEDEDDEVTLKANGAPSAALLSDENAAILASLDGEEAVKKKPKKEKKKKAKKPKKEKKPKTPKPPKPKKEKKPKEVDNTPPLPKIPVCLIWVWAISMFGLVILASNLVGYSSAISNAKAMEEQGEYAEAYKYLTGIKIKGKDMDLYNKIASLAPADSELKAFEVFYKNEMHLQALDSLICAVGRCEVNMDEAELFECGGALELIKSKVTNKLRDTYGVTYEEAMEIYHSKNRDTYTIKLNQKLKELGLE